jgi:hypothetical protein
VCLATCSCRSTNVKETNQGLLGLCVWLLEAVDLRQTHSPTSPWFVSLTLVDLQLQVAKHTVLPVFDLSL